MKKSPYQIVKSRYVTEKSTVLEGLKDAVSNKCLAKCQSPKYVFLVDRDANKIEIAKALEEIYQAKSIKVKKVNTLNVKRKKRRVRGKQGYKSGFKKAVVTLEAGDNIDEGV
ncbi:MAG: 50S ribosomal protein L23 [Chlamydiia bacterium]|nr:50S ribosomal protein L23 [Chlamydiia bacterium]MCH9616551.1 50S ribosomal protein L23 [Chlamydiia bacterium]MCH9629281.1 50S ribosomal protein L23 [Chlamydiia bacterium]